MSDDGTLDGAPEAPEEPVEGQQEAPAGEGLAEGEEGAESAPEEAPEEEAEPGFEIDGQRYTAEEVRRMQKRLADAQQYIRSGGHKRGDAPPEGFEGPDVTPLSRGIFSDAAPPRTYDDFRDWFIQAPDEATDWVRRNPGSIDEEYLQACQSFWAQEDRASYERYWKPIHDQESQKAWQQALEQRNAPLRELFVETVSQRTEGLLKDQLGDLYNEVRPRIDAYLAQFPLQGPGMFFTPQEVSDLTGQQQAQKLMAVANMFIGDTHRAQLIEARRQAALAAAEKEKETVQNAHAKVGETRGNAGGGSSEPDDEDDVVTRAVRRAQGKRRIPG